MKHVSWQLLLAFSISLAAVAAVGRADAGTSQRVVAEPAPVASLEPAATAKLWRHLVATKSLRARATADCRPFRGVFWAATDWLRLATKLAAASSPCAEYYISVPPIVGNKTQLRPDAAWRIRELGPNFHAMAEIHFTSWNRWVSSTGSSWYTAGTTAREHMAAAGYDVSRGDTWVLNEASSAVRRGTGNARANLREFLRGLYQGDGAQPARGVVLMIGVGQKTSDVSLYQTNLQSWLADSAFWTDMSTYVSDWSQEVYGDMRNYAVPGVSTADRRDYLNDYLQHVAVLANAGPTTIETARSYLQGAFSPLANAAWERESGYGWTMVPSDQMAGYVSAQVYALRQFSATTGQAKDHWGFAWAPRNASGASTTDFATRTGQILDRLAAAIRDSGTPVDPSDPGSEACGPPGQNVYCVGDIEGARLNKAWKSFRVWTQPALSFATPAQTLVAGSPSAAMTLSVVGSSGTPLVTAAPVTVTLTSSSARGTFSTSPSGPWSPTLSLTIAAGTSSSSAFYYLDMRAGSPVLTASAAGVTRGTQTETIIPGLAVSLTVTPASATVPAHAKRQFTAVGRDSLGNAFPVSVTWSLTPAAIGTIAPTTGITTTFTASRILGEGTLTATLTTATGTLSADAAIEVAPGRLRIESIRYRKGTRRLAYVTITARDGKGLSISSAVVSVVVKRGKHTHFTKRATTGPAGRTTFRMPFRNGGCFIATVERANARGFVWDGRTPRNRFCG